MEYIEEVSLEEMGSRIKGLLKIFRISRRKLSEEMGISYNSLTKKLNGKRDFSYDELKVIKRVFGLNCEMCGNIFFNQEFLIKKQETIIQ